MTPFCHGITSQAVWHSQAACPVLTAAIRAMTVASPSAFADAWGDVDGIRCHLSAVSSDLSLLSVARGVSTVLQS